MVARSDNDILGLAGGERFMTPSRVLRPWLDAMCSHHPLRSVDSSTE